MGRRVAFPVLLTLMWCVGPARSALAAPSFVVPAGETTANDGDYVLTTAVGGPFVPGTESQITRSFLWLPDGVLNRTEELVSLPLTPGADDGMQTCAGWPAASTPPARCIFDLTPTSAGSTVTSEFDVRNRAPSDAWRVVYVDATGAAACAPTTEAGGCLTITGAAPTAISVAPSAGTPGTSRSATISAENLWPGSVVSFTPAQGVSFTPSAYVSPSDPVGRGGSLTGTLSVSPTADLGTRAATIEVGGTSGSDPDAFTVRAGVSLTALERTGGFGAAIRVAPGASLTVRATGSNLPPSLRLTVVDGASCTGTSIAELTSVVVDANGTSATAALTIPAQTTANRYGVCARDPQTASSAFLADVVAVLPDLRVSSIVIDGQVGRTLPKLEPGAPGYAVTVRGTIRADATLLVSPAGVFTPASVSIGDNVATFTIPAPTTTGTVTIGFRPAAAEGGPDSVASEVATITFIGPAGVSPNVIGAGATQVPLTFTDVTEASVLTLRLHRAGDTDPSDDPILPLTGCTFTSPNLQRCTLDGLASGALGDAIDLVHDADGAGSGAAARQGSMIRIAAPPEVAGVSRSRIGIGAIGASLVIRGSGLDAGTADLLDRNGIPIAGATVRACAGSATEVTCQVDLASSVTPQVATLHWRNRDHGRDQTPCTLGCDVTLTAPPNVSAVTRADARTTTAFPVGFPETLPPGAPGAVEFDGAGLVDAGAPRVTVDLVRPGATGRLGCTAEGTRVRCEPAIPASATPGSARFVLTDPDDGRTEIGFTLQPIPVVTRVIDAGGRTPGILRRGGDWTSLRIDGASLAAGAAIMIEPADDAEIRNIVRTSSSRIELEARVAAAAIPGTRALRITNPDGGSVRVADVVRISDDPRLFSIKVGANPLDDDLADAGTDARIGRGAVGVTVELIGDRFVPDVTTAELAGVALQRGGNACTASSTERIICTANVPPGAPIGVATLTIDNHDAGTPLSVSSIEITEAPVVSDVVPGGIERGTQRVVGFGSSGLRAGAGLAVISGSSGVTLTGCGIEGAVLACNGAAAAAAALGGHNLTVVNGDYGRSPALLNVLTHPRILSTSHPRLGRGASMEVVFDAADLVDGGSLAIDRLDGVTIEADSWDVAAQRVRASITVTRDAALGARRFTLRNPDGGRSQQAAAIEIADAPRLDTLEPRRIGQGAMRFPITLTGAGFVTGSALALAADDVSFDQVRVESPVRITAVATIDPAAGVGLRHLSLTNGDGGTGSAPILEIVAAPRFDPREPSGIGRGALEVPLALTGSGFASDATVETSPGLTASISSIAGERVAIEVSVSPEAPLGDAWIGVVNPDGGRATCACLTITEAPVPTRIDDGLLTRGIPARVTFEGEAIAADARIDAPSGIRVEPVASDPGTLTLELTAAVDASLGVAEIVIVNPDGGRAGVPIEIVEPVSLTGVEQAMLPIGAAAVTVDVHGDALREMTRFDLGADVTVSGIEPTGDGVAVTLRIAAEAATGARILTATNPGGVRARCSCIELVPAPRIDDAVPGVLAQGARSRLVLRGDGFREGAEVHPPQGIRIEEVLERRDRSITLAIAIAPDAPAGAGEWSVTHPSLGDARCACLEISLPPHVETVTPGRIGTEPVEVTITGSGFADGAQVELGPGISTRIRSSEPDRIVVSARSIDALEGDRHVSVRNPDGGTATCRYCAQVGEPEVRVDGFGVSFPRDASAVDARTVRLRDADGAPVEATLVCTGLDRARIPCSGDQVRGVRAIPHPFELNSRYTLELAGILIDGTMIEHQGHSVRTSSVADASSESIDHRWANVIDERARGGRYRVSGNIGASLATTCVGETCVLHLIAGPRFGIAEVSVDGIAREPVDLSADEVRARSAALTGLGPGPHEVVVTVGAGAGDRTRVGVDAVTDARGRHDNPSVITRLPSRAAAGRRATRLEPGETATVAARGRRVILELVPEVGSGRAIVSVNGTETTIAGLNRSGTALRARLGLGSGAQVIVVRAIGGPVLLGRLEIT